MSGMGVSFRRKLSILFLLLGIFPSLVVGLAGYAIGARSLLDNTQIAIETNLQDNVKTLDMLFGDLNERIASISIDNELYEIILKKEPEVQSQLLADNRKVSFILNKYLAASPLVYTAHIITDHYTYSSNSNLPINNQKNRELLWSDQFSGTYANMYWMDTRWCKEFNYDDYYFSVAKRLNAISVPNIEGGYTNIKSSTISPVLLVYFKADLFDSFFRESLRYPGSQYYILTSDNYVFYSSDREMIDTVMDIDTINNSKKNIIYGMDIGISDWKVVEVVPVKSIIEDMSLLQKISISFSIFMTIFAVVVALTSSYHITRPINQLIEGIMSTGKGNFDQIIPVKGNDEFAFLAMKFNEMNENIRKLINENYKRKLHEKENEIIALNMQINPHFLYNTLATINWMAIEKEEKEISHMIVKLCDILHYASKGLEQVVLFSDDMQWLENYLYIMQKRYVNKFRTEIKIDPQCMEIKVPKLFLQPFVENAILHGFEDMESGGILKICAYIKENEAFFKVSDNGKGMSPEMCEGLMTGKEGNIGMKNTIRRIRLIYEDMCKVNIRSNFDGVDICITFKIIQKNS